MTTQSERPPQSAQERNTQDDAGETAPGGVTSRTALADLPLVSPFESAGLIDVFKLSLIHI